jgi:hypothetical protein
MAIRIDMANGFMGFCKITQSCNTAFGSVPAKNKPRQSAGYWNAEAVPLVIGSN